MQDVYTFNDQKDFFELRPAAKQLARDIGFDIHGSLNISSTVDNLVQMVSAIGKNLDISMKTVKNGKTDGFEFSIKALTDTKMSNSFSINGHLSSGFITITRQMDNVCISSCEGELQLVIRKWIPDA
ncbi:MAG: hypothetical protein JXQ65_06060 [Candidatus Marinimicrobia bacterium]|nr:hypothetical protein [Candidatus Neomarinimicrobiota bacterium]